MIRERGSVIVALAGLWLTMMGFFSGMLVERIRYDQQRTLVLSRLSAAQTRLHDRLMALEKSAMRAEPTTALRQAERETVIAGVASSAAQQDVEPEF